MSELEARKRFNTFPAGFDYSNDKISLPRNWGILTFLNMLSCFVAFCGQGNSIYIKFGGVAFDTLLSNHRVGNLMNTKTWYRVRQCESQKQSHFQFHFLLKLDSIFGPDEICKRTYCCLLQLPPYHTLKYLVPTQLNTSSHFKQNGLHRHIRKTSRPVITLISHL